MSMNLFLQAFIPADVAAMTQDHSLVDAWVEDGSRCVMSIDIGTAWDVLNKVLAGAGLGSSGFLDDVLSNGCEVVDAALVKAHADGLAQWTHAQVLTGLRSLDKDDESYRLAYFQEEEEDLLAEFDKLVSFYREAAAQGLAVVFYAA